MSNIPKLKKKAAEYEGRKNFEKALEIYEQVLTTKHGGDEERDVALYNRVGDLHYRIGNTEQAISYYEQAADFYAEGGFFNNAIALCNKILRYSPGRTIVYYKLGIISAKKGFNSDAKQNFLEYADRMQRIGKMDEAFRALKEFADLCPGQDDVRLMLAEQLARANRKAEALEQLELLYDTLEVEGRSSEALATLERMKTLDPAFKPRRSITPRKRQKEGLVFLDLDFDDAVPTPRGAAAEAEESEALETIPEASADSSSDTPEGFVEVPRAEAPEGLETTALAETPEPSPRVDREQQERERSSHELTFITPVDVAHEPAIEVADEASLQIAGDTADEASLQIADDIADESPMEITDDIAAEASREGSDIDVLVPHIDLAPLVDAPDLEHVEDFNVVASEPPATNGNLSNGSHGSNGNGNGTGSYIDIEPIRTSDDDFIDLGEWLERNRTPASTRMVAHDEEPENNEQKDFGEMLDKFKEGISRNVDEEDFESHYDLGIAFREMGLLDEAIGSFQKASRGSAQRVRASEAIGQCFMDKGEAGVTMTVLERLVREPSMSDSQLVGVLYLLGLAAELLGRSTDAAGYFQRVLAVQIGFRDTANRLSALAG